MNKKNTLAQPPKLILKQMEIGPLNNFLYFLGDSTTNEIAVVDPAWDVDHLCEEAEKNNFKIVSVFLTHGHPDHVNGLEEMLDRHDVPVYISKNEAPYYKPKHKNIVEVENHAKLRIGTIEFECILAPGHTPGCQCFYYKNILITGDAVFIDGCGRCDLPGGDAKVMYNTLFNIIKKFPDDTILFPGHNYGPVPYATLADQKRTNPYLQAENMKEFLVQRMGISF